MSRLLYQTENLSFKYRLGSIWATALKEVSISVHTGELVALAGPSGSGKSTLLNILGFIESPQSGKALYRGREIRSLTESEKNIIRRNELGFIFQTFFLFDTLTAYENVAYFLKHLPLNAKEKSSRVEKALVEVGLKDHLHKKPLELSGGQRQRVAIARALVKQPKVIIADEPTASLDQKTGREIMNLLVELVKGNESTVILASHDPMALSFATRTIRLTDGKVDSSKPKTIPAEPEAPCPSY